MRSLETEPYHCAFPAADPCCPITFQTLPLKHLFSHYCLHISHPFALSSYSGRSYFWFPDFVFTFSLSLTAGEFLSCLLSSTAHQESSLKRKKGLVYMVQQQCSHPLHSLLHPFIQLFVLEKPHNLLLPFFSLLHPLGPRGFDTPLTSTRLYCLLFSPLQVPGHSSSSLNLLHLTTYISFLSSIHLLQIPASGKASDFLADTFNTIKSSVFPATSPEASLWAAGLSAASQF